MTLEKLLDILGFKKIYSNRTYDEYTMDFNNKEYGLFYWFESNQCKLICNGFGEEGWFGNSEFTIELLKDVFKYKYRQYKIKQLF